MVTQQLLFGFISWGMGLVFSHILKQIMDLIHFQISICSWSNPIEINGTIRGVKFTHWKGIRTLSGLKRILFFHLNYILLTTTTYSKTAVIPGTHISRRVKSLWPVPRGLEMSLCVFSDTHTLVKVLNCAKSNEENQGMSERLTFHFERQLFM